MSEEEIWTVTDREGVIFLGWVSKRQDIHSCVVPSGPVQDG